LPFAVLDLVETEIKDLDGDVLTPEEFENRSGSHLKSWKNTLKVRTHSDLSIGKLLNALAACDVAEWMPDRDRDETPWPSVISAKELIPLKGDSSVNWNAYQKANKGVPSGELQERWKRMQDDRSTQEKALKDEVMEGDGALERSELGTSGFKGVAWYIRKGMWKAVYQHQHVGYYATPIQAARARKQFELRAHAAAAAAAATVESDLKAGGGEPSGGGGGGELGKRERKPKVSYLEEDGEPGPTPPKKAKMTSKRADSPPKSNKLSAFQAVGHRVRVYWPLDNAWYEGTVRGCDESSNECDVLYDDGEVEAVMLDKEKWEICDDQTIRNATPNQPHETIDPASDQDLLTAVLPEETAEEDDAEYFVASVHWRRVSPSSLVSGYEYLVSWEGFPNPEEFTWEEADNLKGAADDLVLAYDAKNPPGLQSPRYEGGGEETHNSPMKSPAVSSPAMKPAPKEEPRKEEVEEPKFKEKPQKEEGALTQAEKEQKEADDRAIAELEALDSD